MPATLSTARGFYGRHRTAFTAAMYSALAGVLAYRVFPRQKQSSDYPKSGKPRRVAINAEFGRRLLELLRIVIPHGIRSREFWLLIVEAIFLFLRTGLSLYVAKLDGRITSHLVKGEGRKFALSILWWMLVGFPASLTNAVLQYLQRTLALRFRARLTAHILRNYLPTAPVGAQTNNQPVYYSLEDHLHNPDQIITSDVAKFAQGLSSLYANLAKPVLDMFLYTWQLSRNIGADNVFFIGVAIQLSARALRLAAPPFGEYVAEEATLEGDFRSRHTRIIDYAEEIALSQGQDVEKLVVDRSFYALYKHARRTLRHRLQYHFFEDFVIKYYWGALGLVLCSFPVFASESGKRGASDYVQAYVTNRRLLLFCSDAFGRIVESYKEVSTLAGYVARVTQFLGVVDNLAHDDAAQYTLGTSGDASADAADVTIGGYIEFCNVPIITPSGETLIKSLSFRVNQGDHLLIVGPNGSGKSSLFRLLGGLWKLHGGKLVRPLQKDIFYIPQRPYLSRGSLRQLVIYPTSEDDNAHNDSELFEILKVLGIQDLVDQVGGWDTEREWRDDLSMGMQQKIAAARLFYHRPKFAILDECTSNVTLDIETIMYEHAKNLGITLLTVSHRASLWRFHTKILQFDGYGGYIFTDLDAESRLKLEEEKLALDMQLRQLPQMKERLEFLTSKHYGQKYQLRSSLSKGTEKVST